MTEKTKKVEEKLNNHKQRLLLGLDEMQSLKSFLIDLEYIIDSRISEGRKLSEGFKNDK